MIKLSPTAPGKLRVLAAVTAAAVTFGTGATSAWGDASGSSGSTDSAALQIQAQELAAEVQADGRRLDQMAESVNAAEIRKQQLDAQLATLQEQMSQTAEKATEAKATLKEQVVLSYVVGGAPAVRSLPAGTGSDPSLAISYAEIVSGSQKRALDAYRSALAEQSAEVQQIGSAQRDALVTVQQLEADRSSAAQADAARQQALSRITGELAVLVAQVQAAQQAAAKSAVLARSPSPNAPVTTLSPPLTSAPTTRRSNPSPSQPAPNSTVKSTTPPPSPTVRTSPTTTSHASDPSTGSASQPAGGATGQAPGANKALAYARAQLGKPYQWGGAGPDSFDCSGLTMMAWQQAGVYFPHLAQDQYDMTQRISVAQAIPGDLIFFGTPSNVYHVGLYVGNGQMIDA
ncbi:MAG TPA: NlpC/P60 family protein, partial [Acidimicrobiales bacterium]|nr:NlpC/P60 family protein [Acidimicrobiales bacterium]